MPKCFVRGCLSRWGRKDDKHILHIFPKDMNIGKQWLIQLGYEQHEIEELLPKIVAKQKIGRYRVCSRHFTKECYEHRDTGWFLRKGSIPTINLSLDTLTSSNNEHDYARLSTSSPMEDNKPISTSKTESLKKSMSNSSEKDLNIPCSLHSEDNTSQLIEYFTPEMLELRLETEMVTSESMPTSNIVLGLQESKQELSSRQKKRKWHSGTVGTCNDFFTGRPNKILQFDKSFGSKDKKNSHRPLHKSIGIQCKLDEKFTNIQIKSEEPNYDLEIPDYNIVILPSIEEQAVYPEGIYMEFQESNEPIQYQEHLPHIKQEPRELDLSPNSTDLEECGLRHVLLSNSDAYETPQKKKLDVRYNPTLEEEDNFLSETDLHDPNSLDTSFLLLPDSSKGANAVTENKFIVFERCLDNLLMSSRCKGQIGCTGSILKIKKYRVGTAVSVMGFCSEGHKFHLWRSQPQIGNMPVGNLLLSAGILCSGSSFVTVETMLNFMGVCGISNTTHYENQVNFLFPTINHHWQQNRLDVLNRLGNEPVALCGDSQFDTSRHSAKYCMYSFIENKTKKIVDFQIEHVIAETSSVCLETQAFENSLDRILCSDANVKIISTGRHMSIRKKMKAKYPEIAHQFDVRHVAKSIGSKIAAASKRSNMAALSHWVTPAKDHLWWSAKTCELDPKLLQEQWSSVIYHVCNVHHWENGNRYKQCHHPTLTAEQQSENQWLVLGSAAHAKFMEIVLNPRLLKDIEQLSHFSHTEELEVFHSIALKYRPKRTNFFIDGMVARTQLAALDYNHNIGRIQAIIKDSYSISSESERFRHGHYLKKSSKDWVVKRIFQHTNQNFIFDIVEDVIQFALGNLNIEW